ncbi:S8 family serine peptidase [Noviherbaspirillum malthae]|uniref:S8 family serine peptidase n=1 Tax=Noviherbaspirillum malthae TaxID=1260987 RepID=UPI001E2A3CFD|nr:S8 family serine peptidase [Noviherbaspirillum malthae]
MASISNQQGKGPQQERYIIRASDPARLAEFVASVADDPHITILDLIGPAGMQHTAVASMPREAARLLEERFRASRQLMIEPDRPLSLFADGPASQGKAMPKTTDINQPGASGTSSSSGTSGTSGAQDGAAGKPADAQARHGGRHIAERRGQFLITARRLPGLMPMGLMPLQFSQIEQTLRANPDIEVVDTVGPKIIVGMMGDGMGDVPGVLVARMTHQKAGMLHQQAQGRLVVEHDQPLVLHDVAYQPPALVNGAFPAAGPVLAALFVVLGKDNAPVQDAEVYLFGSMLPVSGLTNERGEVTLSMYGETPQTIRALYVKPKSDYWTFYQAQPDITPDEANLVGLRPLSDWPPLTNFPQQQVMGWGQKAMRLDQLPGNYRGQGIKIAIIDSGAATTHDDLKKIRFGVDVINKATNPNGWTDDTVMHGSHCAGIIAGADNAFGVRGFAPDAEIHVCKLFPGGQVSQLIDALEYCIEKQIDVVNLSLGGAEPSEALEQQIIRAKNAGIACIVAAGNSGGRVQYPGSSPNVLAVSAIGHLNEFPPDSYHAQAVTPMIDANGYFFARFSCFGPEIGVCGPGVAITSSVPANNFAAWDGTSMATPHITGLAALVLAHHPDFQAAYKARGPERVERLFQIIKASARPINLGDTSRTGFGLPDVLTAIGIQPGAGAAAGAGIAASVAGIAGMGAQPAAASVGMGPQQAGFFPLGAVYADPAQLAQLAQLSQLAQMSRPSAAPWVQQGQGGRLGVMASDPFGMVFGRQGMGAGSMMPFQMPPGGVMSGQGW